MADGTINVYIDSSFFPSASGIQDGPVSFIAGLADNIGLRDTVVNYLSPTTNSVGSDVTVGIYLTHSGAFQDSYENVATQFQTRTSMSGFEDVSINYFLPATISGLLGTRYFDLKYFTGFTKIPGYSDANLEFTAGNLYAYSTNILGNYWARESEDTTNDYDGHYTARTPRIAVDNLFSYFTLGTLGPGTTPQDCEVSFAGYPIEFHPSNYAYKFHLLSGVSGTKQGSEWESTVISGAIYDIPWDVYSTVTASGHYNFDVVNGKVSFSGIDFPVSLVSYSFDSEMALGVVSYYYKDVVCGASGTKGYNFDIDLLSLKISNFSLDIDEYTHAASTVCVDITDDVHNVVTSGTYFIIDETVISGTSFTPITDGYTMCYDSPTDFENIIGSTTFTVHAGNDNGDILEINFYLTAGYLVEYDNHAQDYGFGSQVVVRGTAENMASCPATETDAYFFTTLPRKTVDLGASITGHPLSEENLSAEITPTTGIIYFYGKEFRIEVRAKDFAGNIMEPLEFEFRIEDKPE